MKHLHLDPSDRTDLTMGYAGEFDLFVSHVEAEGTLLKVWGQKDRGSAEQVERHIQHQFEAFEKGVGCPDPKSLQIGLMCCARYKDGAYYRAEILNFNSSNGMVWCLFIDYGNKEYVPCSALRLFGNARDLSTIPAQTTSFILSGVVGNWDTTTLKTITDDIGYEEVKCTVLKSFGGLREEVRLLKLYHDSRDYLEKLQTLGATLMPQESFEVMLCNNLWSMNAMNPMSAANCYAYPNQPNVMNSWPMWQQRLLAAGPNMFPFQGSPVSMPSMMMPPLAAAPAMPIGPIPATVPPLRSHESDAPVDMRQKPTARPSRFNPTQLDENSEHPVYISFVENGSFEFAVQLASTASKLEELSCALKDGKFTHLKPPFMPGLVCLARFSQDDSLYRAVITNVESDKCTVYFVDYGNSESVKCPDLFEIPDELMCSKPMAIPCCLAGLSSQNCTDEMKNVFHDLILDKDAILKVVAPKGAQPQPKQLAELFIDESNVKELINLEIMKKRPKVFFKNVPLPEAGSKLKVVGAFVKSFDNFYVQLASYQNELESMMAVVTEHCKGPTSKKMVESDIQDGVVCCALFTGDDQWYRAMVINADLQDLTVMYVDYGNEEKVSLENLRHADDHIVSRLRAQAVPCRLSGFTENKSEDLISKFEDLVLDQTLTMHVIQFNKTVPSVVVRLFNETGDVTKQLTSQADNSPSSTCTKGMVGSTTGKSDAECLDRNNRGHQEGPSFSRAPREEGSFNRAPREEGSFNRAPREGGSFNRAPREEGSFNRAPREEGSFSRAPREEGSYSRAPREGGSYSRAPREEGSFNRGSRTESSIRKGFQEEGSFSRGTQQDVSRNRGSGQDGSSSLRDYSASCPKKNAEAWGIGESQSYSGHCDRASSHSDSPKYCIDSNQDVSKSPTRSSSQSAECWNDTAQVKDIKSLTVDIAVKKPVSIVFSTNPCDFYVHERPTDAEFQSLCDEIESHFVNGGEPLPAEDRTVGGVCVAKYSEDDAYYRAKILQLDSNSANVLFVDYGNKEKVEFEFLMKISTTMLAVKAQAIHCKLLGVSETSWPEDKIAEFESLFDHQSLEAEFVEGDEGLYSIILRDVTSDNCGQTINELFGATVMSLLSPKSIVSNLQLRPVLPNGSDHEIVVSWFETPGKFYIQMKSSGDEFRRVMSNMQKDYKSKTSLPNPLLGQVVVAVYPNDGAFYRGIIKVQKGEKYGVLYCDYGNRSLVQPSQIYGLEHQYSVCPAQAILCSLDGVLPLDGEDWKKNPDIARYFDGNFTCTVVQDSGSCEVPCVVRLSSNGEDISRNLIEKGLAVSSSPAPARSLVQESSELISSLPSNIPKELKSEPSKSSEVSIPSEAPEMSIPSEAPEMSVIESSEVSVIDLHMLIGQLVPAVLNLCSAPGDEIRLGVLFEKEKLSLLQDDLGKISLMDLAPLPPLNVVAGQKCLVNIEAAEYRRAVIVDGKATAGVVVRFMDIFGVEEFPSNKIFVLPPKFEVIPPFSYDFVATNVKSNEDLRSLSHQNVVVAVENCDNDRLTGQLLDECGQPLPISTTSRRVLGTILPMPILSRRLPVTVVHASGSTVWMQQVSQADIVSQLIEDMFVMYEESGDPMEEIVAGSACAAKSLDDDNWYRAILLNVSTEEATVQYVDYGNTETLPLSQLKMLKNFLDIPALAVKASLPLRSEDDLGSAIMDFTDGKSFMAVFVKEGTEWLVELLQGEEEISVKLVNSGKAQAMESKSLSAALVRTVHVGSCCPAVLSFFNSPSEFYVHLKCNSKKLDKIQDDLNIVSHCILPLNSFPEVGSKVMALYPEDNVWYRGQVKQDNIIHFLDFGNDEVLELSNLKTLPPSMEQVPSLATKCSLETPVNKRWAQSATGRLQQILEGDFMLKVKSVLNEAFIVSIDHATGGNVTQLLAQEGCLEDESDGGEHTEVIITSVKSPGDFWVSLKNGSKSVMHCALYLPSTFSAWSCAATSYFKDIVAESFTVFEMVTLLPGDPTVVSLSTNGRKIDQEVIALCSQKTWQEVPVEATVVYANSPSDFYIHLTRDSVAVEEMVTHLEKGSAFDDFTTDRGTICAALYSDDGAWYRAAILSEEPGGFNVKFIDYGNTAFSEAIKALPDYLQQIPPLALHCALPLPNETSGWSDAACARFQELIEDQLEIELLSSEEPFVANLTRAGVTLAHELSVLSGIDCLLVDDVIAALRNSLQTVPSPEGSDNIKDGMEDRNAAKVVEDTLSSELLDLARQSCSAEDIQSDTGTAVALTCPTTTTDQLECSTVDDLHTTEENGSHVPPVQTDKYENVGLDASEPISVSCENLVETSGIGNSAVSCVDLNNSVEEVCLAFDDSITDVTPEQEILHTIEEHGSHGLPVQTDMYEHSGLDASEPISVSCENLVETSGISNSAVNCVDLDDSVKEVSVAFDDSITDVTPEQEIPVITINDTPVKNFDEPSNGRCTSQLGFVPCELTCKDHVVDLCDEISPTKVDVNNAELESHSSQETPTEGKCVDDEPDSTFLCNDEVNETQCNIESSPNEVVTENETQCNIESSPNEVVTDSCESSCTTTSVSIQESPKVIVSLITYSNGMECEEDVGGLTKGEFVANAKDFEGDIACGVTGTRMYLFEDCEQHGTNIIDVNTTD